MPPINSTDGPHLSSPESNSGVQRKRLQDVDHEIIDISSPLTQDHLRPSKHRRRNNETTRRPIQSYIPPTEVIEISSGEDETPTQQSIINDLQRQLRKIREETSAYKKDIERMRHEISTLQDENKCLKQASQHAAKGKILIEESELDEHISCEICAHRLWTPYTLPGCGHTFCQSCLQDWFSTTLAQYMNNHPEYNPNIYANQLAAVLADPHVLHHPQLARMAAYHIPPGPLYTCPTCRIAVKSKPVEDFALKSLIKMMATASGEVCPPGVTNPNIWDGFFPR